MSRLTPVLAASALVVAVGLTASVNAQGVVPGGWAPQVGYQQFSGVSAYGSGGMTAVGSPYGGGGFVGGFSNFGGGFAPYVASMPVMTGSPMGLPSYGYNAGVVPVMPQTTIATDPLIGAIRQSVRRSNRR